MDQHSILTSSIFLTDSRLGTCAEEENRGLYRLVLLLNYTKKKYFSIDTPLV